MCRPMYGARRDWVALHAYSNNQTVLFAFTKIFLQNRTYKQGDTNYIKTDSEKQY